MKKTVTLFTLLFLCVFTFAQSPLPVDPALGKVVFKEIIELGDGYKADQIYSAVKEWLSTNGKEFNRSNSEKNSETAQTLFGMQKESSTEVDQLFKNDQPLKLQDPIEKKIIGKGVLKYTGGSIGCIRLMYIEYDIKVYVKDYKLKIEISNLNYTHYNPYYMQQAQVYGLSDKGPCMSKSSIENLLGCDHCNKEFVKLYAFINTDMASVISGLKTFLANSKPSGEDW